MFTRTLLILALWLGGPAARAADLARAMILLPPSGMTPEDVTIAAWQRRVAAPRATIADFDRLGWAFVAKARRTLDTGFYKLAETTANVMDASFGPTADAALLRGHVDHNLHRFHEAAQIAQRLVDTRGQPNDWALLSDALMEEGHLSAAIDALQHLANLKPGPEADTRIAHIRWLKGDLPGAIAAMSSALQETSPQDPTSAAWILARLSGFHLQAGDVARANALAQAAVARGADYPPALLALGRAKMAADAFAEAATVLTTAARLNPLPEYQWALADAQLAAGDATGAAGTETHLCAHGEVNDPRTYALFLATRRRAPNDAVRLARAELDNRKDVLTHDALAWAEFASGDPAGARAEMQAALAEGTRDPRLLLHAALIARANGDTGAVAALAADMSTSAAALLPSERALLQQLAASLDDATPPHSSIAPAGRRPSPSPRPAALPTNAIGALYRP